MKTFKIRGYDYENDNCHRNFLPTNIQVLGMIGPVHPLGLATALVIADNRQSSPGHVPVVIDGYDLTQATES
jgi:hypothetical protein